MGLFWDRVFSETPISISAVTGFGVSGFQGSGFSRLRTAADEPESARERTGWDRCFIWI